MNVGQTVSATDVVASVVLLIAFAAFVLHLRDAVYIIVFAMLVIGPGTHLYGLLVAPFIGSRSVEPPKTKSVQIPARVQFRVLKTGDSRVIDLGFKRFVLFRGRHLNGYFQDWKGLIGHELSHIRHGDMLKNMPVEFLSIHLFTFLIFAFLFALIDPMFRLQDGWLAFSSDRIAHLTMLFVPLLLYAGLRSWVRLSLYQREFRADLDGIEEDRTHFEAWLERCLTDERAKRISFDGVILKMLRNRTHPTFSKRSAFIKGEYDPNQLSNLQRVAHCICIIGFSIFGAQLLALAINELDFSVVSERILIGAVIIICIFACITSVSINLWEALATGESVAAWRFAYTLGLTAILGVLVEAALRKTDQEGEAVSAFAAVQFLVIIAGFFLAIVIALKFNALSINHNSVNAPRALSQARIGAISSIPLLLSFLILWGLGQLDFRLLAGLAGAMQVQLHEFSYI